MISESRVPENGMPGLMSGDWKRSTVSGPQRLQCHAWTAPDLSATAPALDSTLQRLLQTIGHLSTLADEPRSVANQFPKLTLCTLRYEAASQ
jgi:hypothetical protein